MTVILAECLGFSHIVLVSFAECPRKGRREVRDYWCKLLSNTMRLNYPRIQRRQQKFIHELFNINDIYNYNNLTRFCICSFIDSNLLESSELCCSPRLPIHTFLASHLGKSDCMEHWEAVTNNYNIYHLTPVHSAVQQGHLDILLFWTTFLDTFLKLAWLLTPSWWLPTMTTDSLSLSDFLFSKICFLSDFSWQPQQSAMPISTTNWTKLQTGKISLSILIFSRLSFDATLR